MLKEIWNSKRKTIKCLLILFPFITIFFLLLSDCIVCLLEYHALSFSLVFNLVVPDIKINGILFMLFLIIYFCASTYYIIFSKNKYVSKSVEKIYGNAQLATKNEIDNNFPLVKLFDSKNKFGVITNSYESKTGEILCNVRPNTHTMVVAGTRSGKTQGIVIPTLQLFANSEIKPSLLVSDPKGELFETNSKIFKDNGYDVKWINLRQPELSCYWNPLFLAFKNWEKGCKLEKEYEKNTKDINLAKYYFYQQKAQDYISDLCTSLFPSVDPKDKFWQDTASSVVKGILFAILYDMKENNNFDEKKLNLAEIVPIINNIDQLENYIRNLPQTHPARIAAAALLDKGATRMSILQSVKAGLEKFSDPILRTIIINNNLDFNEITKKPTVIFLIVPDDRTDRHIFATLFISQLYKVLVDLASETNNKLERPFYFILDEFANIPTISDMGAKISVSGGRNIWWLLIIQDRPQLVSKYGEHLAKSIANNCSMHIFLQTMDNETANYYSEMLGDKTVRLNSHSFQKSSLSSPKGDSFSSSIQGIKLISSTDLKYLQPGEAIVIYSREKPFKGKLIPMWKIKQYKPASIKEDNNYAIVNYEKFQKDYFYNLFEDDENDDD